MKFRHTALLALVGWYLMFPPIDPSSRRDPSFTEQQPDLKAPLYMWSIADEFDSADECKTAMQSMKPTPAGFWANLRCVSSEDAQLKGKQLRFVPDSK
jgi:hypothetical protein